MKNLGFVIASKMLVDNSLAVKFMYREKGEGNDSGWRFFSGSEDQSYVDNPDNLAIYDINTILDIDRSIKNYLESVPGTAFERQDDGTFKMLEDFSFAPENIEA